MKIPKLFRWTKRNADRANEWLERGRQDRKSGRGYNPPGGDFEQPYQSGYDNYVPLAREGHS